MEARKCGESVLRRKALKALKIFKTSGLKGVAETVADRLSYYIAVKMIQKKARMAAPPIPFKDVKELAGVDFSIAVHIHLYYEDLAGEFCGYLQNIPFDFDLYVSCREGVDAGGIEKKFCSLCRAKKIAVKNVENRGRDLLPFYVIFGKELAGYKYVMHAHTKKSLHYGREQVLWRENSMNALCGSQELVQKIFYMFETKSAGLVYPENYETLRYDAYSWVGCKAAGRALLKRLRVPCPSGFFLYPAGSFFWARTQAIKPIFDLNLTRDDFPVEQGQKDGTIAHALERAVAIVSRRLGFHDVIVDIRGKAFRKDFSPLAFERLG